jgi:hypothetical protein
MPSATYVAVGENDGIPGTCYIKPNQPGLGSRACNVQATTAMGRLINDAILNIRKER